MGERIVGIIGGSGLYEMEGLENVKEEIVSTPFGDPSDNFIIGYLEGVKMIFLPRHGRGHRILPSEINFRANIYGMKKLGAQWIISVSAVGSMKEHLKPGHIVIPDQFFDRTKARINTFFGNGIAAHVSFSDPVCPVLSDCLFRSAMNIGAHVHKGGVYICIEGPQFSTKAESHIYRSWGVDVIGMTNLPEAKLAREAEICYATLALVTDYDCWHEAEEPVTAEMVMETLSKNIETSKKIIKNVIKILPDEKGCLCGSALKNAIMTQKEKISSELKKRLDILIGKYLNA